MYFEPVYPVRGKDSVFSNRGDSGALVVTAGGDGEERALGLIFAGDLSRHLSYMLPIAPILKTLGVELVGCLNA